MLTASALDNAFDFDLGFDWWTAMKLRPGEKENWLKTWCYILTLAKAVEILKTPQNPNFGVPKKILVDRTATCCYSWETELVGRAKKDVMPTAPSVPRRSPGGAPVKRLQLLGQMLPHLSTKASIWWIQSLLVFCYFPGFVLSWEFAHKSRSWADSCPIVFQWPWHSRGGWVYRPDLWSASLLGLLAKIKV